MRVNYDEEKKEYIKREDSKRKKEKHDNLNEVERKQLRKYEKEAKKVICDNLDDEKKKHLRKRITKEIKKSVIASVIMEKYK